MQRAEQICSASRDNYAESYRKVTVKKWTALHAATFNRRKSTALLLIEAGADMFALDELGFTPIDGARKQGEKQLVSELIQISLIKIR